jgi:hypothetical protein
MENEGSCDIVPLRSVKSPENSSDTPSGEVLVLTCYYIVRMWVRNKFERRIQNGTEFLKPWAARKSVSYFSQLIRDKVFGLFNDTVSACCQQD